MLFRVSATHTEENCPGYHTEMMPTLLAAAEKQEETAKELGIKVQHFLNGAPEHVFYALIEADNVASVGRFFISGLPIVSSFKVTAVQPLEETIAMGRAMMARTGS